jgi:hypothetical protein
VCSQPPRREHLFAGYHERPSWVYASRTSEKRGGRCYLWTGCAHATVIATEATKVPVGPEGEGFAKVEAAWNEALSRLFTERTANWDAGHRSELARFLEDRNYEFASPLHVGAATHETTKHE